jgi:hypothetical protein
VKEGGTVEDLVHFISVSRHRLSPLKICHLLKKDFSALFSIMPSSRKSCSIACSPQPLMASPLQLLAVE